MSKFLRQAGTGQFYIFNPILAQRPDMVPCDADEVPVAFGGTMEPKPAKAKKADKEAGE